MRNPFKKQNGSMRKSLEKPNLEPGTTVPLQNGTIDSTSDVSDTESRGNWTNQIEFILSCVGYAVGIGNLWRFPYLCMRNGGGAFLIPYFTSLFLCGVPLFFLELSIGQFSSLSPLQIWNICPIFKGLGYGMVIVSGIVSVYYNLIITWVLYYLFKSFTTRLPWSECGHWWNTPLCLVRTAVNAAPSNSTHDAQNQTLSFSNATDNNLVPYYALADQARIENAKLYANISGNQTIPWKSPAEEFWQHNVLELSSGIGDLDGIKWELFGCLILSWVICFGCLFKGVQSSGKVVYVTATLPYVFLTIFLIRGLLLDGAIDGLKYYLIPEWSKLLEFRVWAEASLQIFYSLGPAWGGLITMASYNKFNHNCYRDAILVPLVNCGTSFYGGFVIFSVIGFMAKEAGLPVKDVITTGPGLAFIAYPEAITKLPISPMWAIFFFLMLLLLGLDSQFGMVETMTSSLIDQFPKYLRKYKIVFTLCVCVVEIIVAVPLVSRAGMYFFQIMDWYVGSFSVMVISIFESFIISWIYGHDRIYYDIELMIGKRPGVWWKICWGYISPTILLIITVYNVFAMGEPYYGDYYYPRWAIAFGWSIAIISIVPIPVFFVKEILSHKGTFLQRLKQGLQPTSTWGPSDPEVRAKYNYANQNRICVTPFICVQTDPCHQSTEDIHLQEKFPINEKV